MLRVEKDGLYLCGRKYLGDLKRWETERDQPHNALGILYVSDSVAHVWWLANVRRIVRLQAGDRVGRRKEAIHGD